MAETESSKENPILSSFINTSILATLPNRGCANSNNERSGMTMSGTVCGKCAPEGAVGFPVRGGTVEIS